MRKIEITDKTGVKHGTEYFAFGDVRTVDAATADHFVKNGWAKFVDGGAGVLAAETPKAASLQVQPGAIKQKSRS